MAADDLVHRHEADVVPVVGVAGARIAELGKQQHAGHPLAWRVPDVPGLAWLVASRARETCRTARRLSPRPTGPLRPCPRALLRRPARPRSPRPSGCDRK